MPKNNSSARKNDRRDKAMTREKAQTYRTCGHWHTDNGYSHCVGLDKSS